MHQILPDIVMPARAFIRRSMNLNSTDIISTLATFNSQDAFPLFRIGSTGASLFMIKTIPLGGWSSRYKKFITERGIVDETYVKAKASLFRVQGTDPNNMQAIQVDLVSGSLNSSYCYILQTGASVFTWLGNLSSQRDHDLLDRALDLINDAKEKLAPYSALSGDEEEEKVYPMYAREKCKSVSLNE
ncbi:hypothetical protein Syun_031684 [Stephania yunnanensis]|uniref:Gelsolin-like domain-containing protein n=1 Tax=Stephania yunnanensis TaxID=152371 RepID=A0AAP0DV25_9MAGN